MITSSSPLFSSISCKVALTPLVLTCCFFCILQISTREIQLLVLLLFRTLTKISQGMMNQVRKWKIFRLWKLFTKSLSAIVGGTLIPPELSVLSLLDTNKHMWTKGIERSILVSRASSVHYYVGVYCRRAERENCFLKRVCHRSCRKWEFSPHPRAFVALTHILLFFPHRLDSP